MFQNKSINKYNIDSTITAIALCSKVYSHWEKSASESEKYQIKKRQRWKKMFGFVSAFRSVWIDLRIYLPSATKLRRLCFYTCSQGGCYCLSVCWDTPPGADRPPPPMSTLPWEQTPPSEQTTPADFYCCGRYASHWNAFLFKLLSETSWDSQSDFPDLFSQFVESTTGNNRKSVADPEFQ